MTLFWLCVAGFFAAFVDSMVGGGGLISLPALLATGMPTHLALGTNKFAASSGALSSVYHYYKSGTLKKEVLLPLVPMSLLGSSLGVLAVLALNPDFLKNLIIIMILVMIIYNLINPHLGLHDHYDGHTKKERIKAQGFTTLIGFYDGFFGPGTGSFFIMMLIHIFGMDFRQAAGVAKSLNLASNMAALTVFLISGQVYFKYGLLMAVFMMIGARFGTLFAVKKGPKWIKPIFILVSIALVSKMILERLEAFF